MRILIEIKEELGNYLGICRRFSQLRHFCKERLDCPADDSWILRRPKHRVRFSSASGSISEDGGVVALNDRFDRICRRLLVHLLLKAIKIRKNGG